MTDLNPDKEITDVTFEYEGSHLAFCHKSQGFSANGRPEALLIKSASPEATEEAKRLDDLIKAGDAEVKIETDMRTFLRRWMGLYWDDAEALAKILGYEKEEDEPISYIDEKVKGITLLKSKTVPRKAKASEVVKLQSFIKSHEALINSFSEGNSEPKTEIEKSQNPSEKTKPTQGDAKVTDALTLEKAQSDILDMQAKLAEFEKANKEASDRIAAFEKANQERLEKAFEKKVETYSFVTPEERVDFAKTLLALNNEKVIEMLDKAQAAISASLTKEQGIDGAGKAPAKVEKSGVKEKILAMFPEIELDK